VGQRVDREEGLTVGITFTNGLGGISGVGMSCRHCEAPLERDPETGNYRCPTPGCGRGSLSSPDGITTTVDEEGRTVTLRNGKPS